MSSIEYVRMAQFGSRQLIVGINRDGVAVWSKFVRNAPSYFEWAARQPLPPRRPIHLRIRDRGM
jgi:hypothetical protein